MRPTNEPTKRDQANQRQEEAQNNKQAKKEPNQNQKPKSQEETTKEEGREDLKQQTTQPPTHYELGASVPSASAVAEASDHRPSVLGATG
jgi:hypothetical protein